MAMLPKHEKVINSNRLILLPKVAEAIKPFLKVIIQKKEEINLNSFLKAMEKLNFIVTNCEQFARYLKYYSIKKLLLSKILILHDLLKQKVLFLLKSI